MTVRIGVQATVEAETEAEAKALLDQVLRGVVEAEPSTRDLVSGRRTVGRMVSEPLARSYRDSTYDALTSEWQTTAEVSRRVAIRRGVTPHSHLVSVRKALAKLEAEGRAESDPPVPDPPRRSRWRRVRCATIAGGRSSRSIRG